MECWRGGVRQHGKIPDTRSGRKRRCQYSASRISILFITLLRHHPVLSLVWMLPWIVVFACSSTPPPDITDPGQLIYLGYADKDVQCSRCHGPGGQGGMFGPSLRGSVRRLGVDSARQIIRFGRGAGDKRMEGLEGELSTLQIEQVIAFIKTWQDSLTDSTSTNDSH